VTLKEMIGCVASTGLFEHGLYFAWSSVAVVVACSTEYTGGPSVNPVALGGH